MSYDKALKHYAELGVNLAKGNLIFVDTATMALSFYKGGKRLFSAACSYGKAGLGSEEDSGKTPLGLHRISEKIGSALPAGSVLKSRKPTGEIWSPGGKDAENMILSRILRLNGEEEGINRGPGIDSYERYIYIHGTNREEALGKEAVSHGCILLANSTIIELFELVEEGDYVLIY